ncbi:MAG TPA: efflux RND transporter periplasmic adaptor subunit [Candidatus Limnocylindrales bacterium]|jgi:multidrug efflux system membrane fusion protein|nr:efflux RND transporter periplasmic adaptor subunit [Candidatus Limnocylindrales bacterium]
MDSHSSQTEASDDERQAPEITPPPKLPPAPPRKALLLIGLVLLLLFVGGLITMLMRMRSSHVLADETERESIPTVAVIHPTAEKPDEELVLPGSLQAYEESPVYARTNGYLLRWYKDMGSHVKQGELLADIDTPEVDQELMQVRANRQQIVAAMDLAKINADRYVSLRKTDSVSQQESDQQSSGYQQAKANLDAADATVRRLEQLESFKHVYAPFSGVLTKRNVDPGALINSGGTGKELFDIAKVDPLRVFVSVPQNYAPAIKNGMEAWVSLPELSGEKFKGMVVRTAESIDPMTRTLLTEVDVPNRDGRLLPGSFGEVHFRIGINVQKLTIPVNAMLFRQEGPRVAVVGSDGKVHLRPIVIGKDYGATLEILGGVEAGDRVIVNPADSIEEGQQVNVAPENQGGQQS